ncbi:hypothetical protein C8R47DRAFT_518684 [Mycena vitilis]|nr:hypothetical protein C8R47DRAFT_518684 [Mycena vitilis]
MAFILHSLASSTTSFGVEFLISTATYQMPVTFGAHTALVLMRRLLAIGFKIRPHNIALTVRSGTAGLISNLKFQVFNY